MDEYFKEIHDNWWTATRHKVQSYEEFKTQFRAKYWSEATQNIVRDNICHGKYDASKGATLTSYFLGKVCLARDLEPKIPEECLVTKLAYHFEEGVAKARQWGQMKTIQAMSALLEDNEHEGYYRRSRRRNENFHDRSGNVNNNNSNFRNYRGNFNNSNQNNANNNNENNYRPSNQNNNNNSTGNYNNNNTRRPNYNNQPNRLQNQGRNCLLYTSGNPRFLKAFILTSSCGRLKNNTSFL